MQAPIKAMIYHTKSHLCYISYIMKDILYKVGKEYPENNNKMIGRRCLCELRLRVKGYEFIIGC